MCTLFAFVALLWLAVYLEVWFVAGLNDNEDLHTRAHKTWTGKYTHLSMYLRSDERCWKRKYQNYDADICQRIHSPVVGEEEEGGDKLAGCTTATSCKQA